VTEFAYGRQLSNVFYGCTALKYLVNWGEGWGLMPSGSALAFIDGGSMLTFREPRLYKMAVGFMLAHPYGATRVLSSYFWPENY